MCCSRSGSAQEFDRSALSKADLALLEFHAPWCSHCKQLAPFYSEAAKLLAEKGSKVVLAQVDAESEAWDEDTGELSPRVCH